MFLALLFLIFFCWFSFGQVSNDCSWLDPVGDYYLNLAPIQGKIYSYANGTFNYSYSPCSNNIRCTLQNGTTVMVMSSEYKPTNTYCTTFLARYTQSVAPTYDASNGNWVFNYANGQSSKGTGSCKTRNLTVTYECSTGLNTVMIKAGEPKNCRYYITLASPLGCNATRTPTSLSTTNIPTIFFLVFFCLFVFVCFMIV